MSAIVSLRTAFVSEKRRRQIRLIYDLVLDLGAMAFGIVGVVWLGYTYVTPSLRDQPFDTSLEKYLGHTGTFLFFLAFSLAMIAVGAYFARRTILLLRDKTDLEAPPPNP